METENITKCAKNLTVMESPANTENTPLETKVEKQETENKPRYKKIVHCLSSITVEPYIALYVIGNWTTALATQNLNIEKACRINLNYGQNVCDSLQLSRDFVEQEIEVQKLVSELIKWKSICTSSFPAFFLMFLGAWSDRTQRRKPLILAPFIGDFVMNIGMLLNTYFFEELPLEVAGVTETVFVASTGGLFTLFLGVYSYIASITDLKTRTFRLGFAMIAFTIARPIGTSLSGILLKLTGFYGVFGLAALANFLTFVYGFFSMREPDARIQIVQHRGCCGFLVSFFDLKYFKETINIVFKKGRNHRRLRIFSVVFMAFAVLGILSGEGSLTYLFMRYRFNWDAVEFSIFATFDVFIQSTGNIFVLNYFSRYLEWDDAIIGIISVMSKLLSTLVYIFVTDPWLIYTAPVIEIFRAPIFAVVRSMASKLVGNEDIGKINAILSLADAAAPVVFGPLYAKTYATTIEKIPYAIYILSAIICLPLLGLFTLLYYLYYFNKNSRRSEAQLRIDDRELAPLQE